MQLARALTAGGGAVEPPEIIARTGWTTGELDAAIAARAPAGKYALVSLLIGVNDQYRGHDAEAYRASFRAVLARAIGFAERGVLPAAARVIVASIPDWGVTPFTAGGDAAHVAREIDAFNAVAWDETRRAGARWVDVTDLTRADPAAVAADGLHPTAAMYARWVVRLVPVARAILTNP